MSSISKINMYDFFRIDTKKKESFPNINYIINLIQSYGLNQTNFGFYSEYDKYFTLCNLSGTNNVSSLDGDINCINLHLNNRTSTRSKRIYIYSLKIVYIEGYYYLKSYVQTTSSSNKIGPEPTIYKLSNIIDIKIVLDEVFKDVE